MEKRSVSRCVAVAAHGKRCQQTPFRGSPYCWHHTQSRKIPPPSRPLAASGPRAIGMMAAAAAAPERVAAEARPALEGVTAAEAERLLELLGPERARELLAFLEGRTDDTLHLMRLSGRLIVDGGQSALRRRRRRAG